MIYQTTHRPLHFYFNNTIYFITGRTYNRIKYFNTEDKLENFNFFLKQSIKMYKIKVFAWVLLGNHYHLLIKVLRGEHVKNFCRKFHSDTAIYLNKTDNTPKRKVWYQYWDYCPRNKKDFYTHLNYIHHNPVKHGICKNQKQVERYDFCSYDKWFHKMGEEWILSCFSEYPIIDFTIEGYR